MHKEDNILHNYQLCDQNYIRDALVHSACIIRYEKFRYEENILLFISILHFRKYYCNNVQFTLFISASNTEISYVNISIIFCKRR